jgi:hypothetical protein
MNLTFLAFILFFLLISLPVHALMVGVAPGSHVLGEVKRGQVIQLPIYIISDTKEKISISLQYQEIPPSPTELNVNELSEENFKSWINFVEGETVEITPEKKFYPEIGLAANKKYFAILNIPENAEPGYHTAGILLQPLVSPPAERGLKIPIITTSAMRILFKVEGEARRSLDVVGFLEEREDPSTLLVKVFLLNSGTVTLTSTLENFTIFDENNNVISSNRGTSLTIAPNQVGYVFTRINLKGSNLEEGKRYNATAIIRHASGGIVKSDFIRVPPYVAKIVKVEKKVEVPWVIIFILLLIVFTMIILYWKRGG